MVRKDPYKRTWDGKDICWIRRSCIIHAEYHKIKNRASKDEKKSGNFSKWKLIYDPKYGMYDRKGRYVKNAYYEEVPVLLNIDGTWEEFPNTEEAQIFRWNLYASKT